MDITVGPLVNLWGFGPEQQPVQIPSQEQIDAMKTKTGLQHLTVINQSHEQYLRKRPAGLICQFLHRRRLCGHLFGVAPMEQEGFPVIRRRWAARSTAVG
ncbi:FAD:protein FMN transferase [Shigella flexneri]